MERREGPRRFYQLAASTVDAGSFVGGMCLLDGFRYGFPIHSVEREREARARTVV